MVDVSVIGREKCKYCKITSAKAPEVEGADEVDGKWIRCDVCKQWIHYSCVNLTQTQADAVSKYHCPDCTRSHGPSEAVRVSKRRKTAIDYVALDSGDTMGSTMVHAYCGLFKTRQFDTSHIKEMKGSDLTAEWAETSGLKEPVIVRKEFITDLGLSIPSDLDVHQVSELVGKDSSVEVIDVVSQGLSPGWTMGKWEQYYYGKEESEKRRRIHNVISLEFSDTLLSKLIQRPQFVRDMDLVDKVWPQDLMARGDFPKVKLYCLMSVQDSYTDFHIDFGGSSVFYHVCQGSKTFLFIPPTKVNLSKYMKWCNSPDQSSQFFGDICSECYRVDLQKNDTLIIPSGWIHAVYTPIDSLVIGGNFLTAINIPMQIGVTDVEKKTKVPKKFRFPHFRRVLWFTACYYYDHQLSDFKISDFEIEGLQQLLQLLSQEVKKAEDREKDDEKNKTDKISFKGLPSQVKVNPRAFLEKFATYIHELLSKKKEHVVKNEEKKQVKQE